MRVGTAKKVFKGVSEVKDLGQGQDQGQTN